MRLLGAPFLCPLPFSLILLQVPQPSDVPGTTSVVAKKTDRHYVGVEVDRTYCCLTEKRLERASQDATIQGYADGVFWERNSS